MSANTKIEWADHTFNPWIGCTKVSPGCDNCYAKADFEDRKHRVIWGAGQARSRTKTWGGPVKWNAQHAAFFAEHGRRQRVFCASLADVFDNDVDREWRDDLATLMLNTPDLDWLLLTKRIGNAGAMLGEMFLDGTPDNVWLGATIINQEEADRDIVKLLRVSARVHFISNEPALAGLWIPNYLRPSCTRHPGALDADGKCQVCEGRGIWGIGEELAEHEKAPTRKGLDWVIVGGESGPGARPMHPDWARSLRDQCEAAGVPFLFKQWGEWLPAIQDGAPDRAFVEINASDHPIRVGKKAAGRILDGRTWDGVPST